MRKLYLGSDHQIVRDVTEWNTATGEHAAKSGLTLTGFISLTKDGATIHASLSKALSEVGSTGRYYATVPGADIAAQLAPYVGKVVYERVTGTGYSDYEPMRVEAARPAGE